MEHVSGIKLKHILLDNGNWWKFYLRHYEDIRIAIAINVLKVLVCGTSILGFGIYLCRKCGMTIRTPHTCKSRFCSSCGKKATDDWIKNSFNTLPKTKWQHITFTLPDVLWDFFWMNRSLMKKVPPIAANIIVELAEKKAFLPGIFLAIHTFGRDLKRNFHIHLSTTVGGICLPDRLSYTESAYFHHRPIKNMWKYRILKLLKEEFKQGNLKMPPKLRHIKTYSAFNSWTSQLYKKDWVVELSKQSENMKNNVEYLGKYLKRPPIGETRIKKYDGKTVTYEYLDHYTNTKETLTLSVLDFIARIVTHIPDKYFRNIRYYGFLSTRTRGKLLPKVYEFLDMKKVITKKVYTRWRQMLLDIFKRDPMKCPVCNITMQHEKTVLPLPGPIINFHQQIANGHPLLL